MKRTEDMKKPLLIRLNDQEKQMAEDRAKGLGLSLSAYIRFLIHRDGSKQLSNES
jgi:antitoxin component of RelBE/YafQ-DinJ toxin-antitoxin module